MILLLKRLSLAILFPAALLLLVESGLRIAGQGVPSRLYLVGEWDGQALVTENAHYTRKYFGSRLERAPWPVAFPVPKPAGEYRVFLLGESAALGDPIPEYGMARLLEVLLQDAMTNRRVRVVNSAITAINSHVIREIAREVAELEPDAVVVYMGNNEVVGPFGPGTVFTAVARSPVLIRWLTFLRGTFTGQLVEAWSERWRKRPNQWAGMEMFLERRVEADDPRLATTRALFRRNLEAIARTFASQGTPVVLSTVAVNLRDCAPLGAGDTNHPSVRAFLAAQQAERAGDLPGALARYREAMERDPLRFRADAALNEAIREVATNARAVQLVDGEAVIAAASTNGLPGESMFYDHVHLTFAGQYRIARAFAEALTGSTDPLAMEKTAERLGWSAFSEREAQYEMFARRLHPPFAGQVDQHEVEQRWIERLISSELALRQMPPGSEARVLETALAARGDRDAETWKVRAARDLADRRPDRAAEAFGRAAALWPHQASLRLDQAAALAATGREEEAFTLIRDDARWSHWRDDAIWAGLAIRLLAAGQSDYAQPLFHKAWLLNPENPDVLINLGASRAIDGEKNEAVALLRRAVALRPEDAVAWANLGRALYERGDTADGLAALEKASSLEPDNALTLSSLGVAYLREKRRAEARRCLDRALELQPLDVSTLNDAIGLALADQRFVDAAELQERVARLSLADAAAQYRAGQLWLKNDQPVRAIPFLQRALELAPGRADWRRNLAWLLATHPDDAVRDPARAQQLAGSLDETGDDAWMDLDVRAAIHAANGRMDEAVASADRIRADQVPPAFRTRVQQRAATYREGKPYLGTRAEYIPE